MLHLIPYLRKRIYRPAKKEKPVSVILKTGFSISHQEVVLQSIQHVQTIITKQLQVFQRIRTENDTVVTGTLKVFSAQQYNYRIEKQTRAIALKTVPIISETCDNEPQNIRTLFHVTKKQVIPLSTDDQTFTQQVLDNQKYLYSFACKLTLDTIDAHDLVQDTIYQALKKRHLYKDDNISGWLFQIMHNIWINQFRKASVRNEVHSTETFDIFSIIDNPVDLLNIETHTKEIIEHIESLPPCYRVPFKMHVEGYTYEEITAKLQIPMGTVKSRIHFARKKLQELCKDYL